MEKLLDNPLKAIPSLRGLIVNDSDSTELKQQSRLYPWTQVGYTHHRWRLYDHEGYLVKNGKWPVNIIVEKGHPTTIALRAQYRAFRNRLLSGELEIKEHYEQSKWLGYRLSNLDSVYFDSVGFTLDANQGSTIKGKWGDVQAVRVTGNQSTLRMRDGHNHHMFGFLPRTQCLLLAVRELYLKYPLEKNTRIQSRLLKNGPGIVVIIFALIGGLLGDRYLTWEYKISLGATIFLVICTLCIVVRIAFWLDHKAAVLRSALGVKQWRQTRKKERMKDSSFCNHRS